MKIALTHSLLGLSLLLCSSASGQNRKAKSDSVDLTTAQTVEYCEILNHPEAYNNKSVRVRALHTIDFESASITAPACSIPIPTTWVDFDKDWERRTGWLVRHAINTQQWRIPMDVVFVGKFKGGGHYGQMDMYPYSLNVYKVESIQPSGRFRPLPDHRSK